MAGFWSVKCRAERVTTNRTGAPQGHSDLARLLAGSAASSTPAAGRSGRAAISAPSSARSRCGWRSPPSGLDKGALSRRQILEIDGEGASSRGCGPALGRDPATPRRRARARGRRRPAHPLGLGHAALELTRRDGVELEGFEMLKGLAGVRTHEHREWLPVLDNDAGHAGARAGRSRRLWSSPGRAWLSAARSRPLHLGRDLAEARRHVEILEFLLEVRGREFCASGAKAKGEAWPSSASLTSGETLRDEAEVSRASGRARHRLRALGAGARRHRTRRAEACSRPTPTRSSGSRSAAATSRPT